VGAEASAPRTVAATAQCGGAEQRRNKIMKPVVVTTAENMINPAHPAYRHNPKKSSSESHSCETQGDPVRVNENASA
jgi:hypothetical protein